jgi:hypothetical protein
MHKAERWYVIVCALLIIAVSASALGRQRGGYMGWVAASPVSQFNDEDKQLLREAAEAVVSGAPGNSRDWENPKTGNHGKLTLLASFNGTDGRPCHQVRVQNHAKGLSGDSKVSICKDPQRGWLLDTQEPPKN